ncbi:MAG: metallophosphoesterase family protein [Actinobacteria bacterium]|nr:metallophosphoesterase family protein [Actinomycetota bacterium]
MPRGSRRLPDRCSELLAAAEAVIHVGDFHALATLTALEALNPRLHAVHGNVDEAALRARLPETLELGVGDRTLALIHDAGPAKGRLARMRRRFPAADAVVFGHSHLPLHEVGSGELAGFEIFNPGSPTERRRAPGPSMGLLEADRGGLRFRHLWL